MMVMENYNSDGDLYKKAKKRVDNIKAFYMNLLCYCIVIPILIFINLYFTPEFYWFIFSALGWGLGLAFHGVSAFNTNVILSRNWEQRKIQELMEKEKSNETNPKS